MTGNDFLNGFLFAVLLPFLAVVAFLACRVLLVLAGLIGQVAMVRVPDREPNRRSAAATVYASTSTRILALGEFAVIVVTGHDNDTRHAAWRALTPPRPPASRLRKPEPTLPDPARDPAHDRH